MHSAAYIAKVRTHLPHQYDAETLARLAGCSVALARAVRAANRAPLHVDPLGTGQLTPAQIAAMRAMHALGVTANGVAVAFGCGQSQAQRVCNGTTYKAKRRKRCPHCGKFVE